MRPEEELRFLILAAQREGSRGLSAALAPLELTPAQAEVVRCLADHEPMSLRELGAMLVCESGSPSRLVDSMVKREIVTRTEDAADRRSVTLMLTAEGKRLDRAVRKVEEALYRQIGGQLGAETINKALALLRPLVAGSAGGEAIARRKSAEGKR
jgi:DNA-binding MarR family transcriptional regulator